MMARSTKAGFSLVEIVLALGIVSVSLLAIFGMFGAALKTNNETISQQEVLGMTRSFNDFLRATNASGGGGFTNVYPWIVNTNNQPRLMAFVMTNGIITNGFATNSTFRSVASDPRQRQGRLYEMKLSLSPNMPLRQANGSLIARPQASDLPATAAAYTNDAMLAIQVSAHVVPSVDAIVTNQPVFTYETTLSR